MAGSGLARSQFASSGHNGSRWPELRRIPTNIATNGWLGWPRGFVDLVKFTSLTAVHGDMAGADAALAIEQITRRIAGSHGRLVKTAGDGVLVEAPSALDVLRMAGAVIEEVHVIGLDARAGVDVGPVIVSGDDIFGSTVNTLPVSLLSLLREWSRSPGQSHLRQPGHLGVSFLRASSRSPGC